ncbi:hypothetical protein KIN20_016225 [Parelaphostrongylus tenuis]|uniref:Protein quiver n=1 Tax=Parelaphostrongylus tenuis TaxID=148309 RepID=A0AAD5N1P7_PARTN|nr:hypothetical protein KIN20_016225 [Parelaphostrongylus tenuis]
MFGADYVLLIYPLFTYCQAACYHCFSSDASLEPRVRTQLGTQEDVFFMPIASRSSSCSYRMNIWCARKDSWKRSQSLWTLMEFYNLLIQFVMILWCPHAKKIKPNRPGIEGQLCSSSPLCVTLTPNIENSSFVVRGCLEYILRHNLKKENITKEGCYMVRSLSSRYSNFTMEYVLCVCSGDYCNGEEPPDFVPGPLLFSGETVLPLRPREGVLKIREGPLLLEVSSSVLKLFSFTWMLIILLRFVF